MPGKFRKNARIGTKSLVNSVGNLDDHTFIFRGHPSPTGHTYYNWQSFLYDPKSARQPVNRARRVALLVNIQV